MTLDRKVYSDATSCYGQLQAEIREDCELEVEELPGKVYSQVHCISKNHLGESQGS